MVYTIFALKANKVKGFQRYITDEFNPYFLAIIVSISAYSSEEIKPLFSICFTFDIVVLYRRMVLNNFSSIEIYLLPSGIGITRPRAVFAMRIIALKRFTAVLTNIIVHCFSVYQLRVRIPPIKSTFIRAEFFLSLMWGVFYWFTALQAHFLSLIKRMSSAIGLYSIF